MYQDLVEQLNVGRFTKVKWARFKAVINCLTPQDACLCALEMLSTGHDRYMRDALCQKLSVDIIRDGWQLCHETLCRKLLTAFNDLETPEKQQHAYVLARLTALDPMPAKHREDVLLKLLISDLTSVRRYAYQALHEIKKADFTEVIELAWITYGDKGCAQLIVKHCSKELQERHFASLWAVQNEWITIALFLNVELTPKRLDSLKQTDGITYAYICAKRGIVLSDKEATELWTEYAKDERAGLLLWCFGQMKLWNFLVKLDLGPKKKPKREIERPMYNDRPALEA